MTSVVRVNVPGIPAVKSNDPASPSPKKSNGKRKSASLPSETVEYLKAWMMSPEHIAHPYPTEQEKVEIMKATKIELKQLTNWFVNNRKRYWKPRVEARLQQQAQAAQAAVQAHNAAVAAVSATKCAAAQKQLMVGVGLDSSRTNLLSSPVTGFKLASRTTLPSKVINSPILRFDSITSPPPTLQQKPFASSPLTLMAQVLDHQSKPFVPIPRTSTATVTNTESSSTAAASVSASEGEMSDSGNASDDISMDGANVLVPEHKFIHHKMKKKSLIKSKISSINPQLTSSQTIQDATSARTSHARNVSFCSLDKIPSNAASISQISAASSVSSNNSKKRANVDNELPLVVATCTTIHTPKRFRTESTNLWRKKCEDATTYIDEDLPSLDEAARLFGFTSA